MLSPVRQCATQVGFMVFYRLPIALAASQDELQSPTVDIVGEAARTFKTIILGGVALMVAAAAAFIIYRIRNEIAFNKSARPAAEASLEKAKKKESKGDYAGAAEQYEAVNDFPRAASMYEKARDFSKAGGIYESMEKLDKAVEMYKKSGESLKAAAVYIKLGNYFEAAKIFKNKGDRLRAAQALEMFGNKLAAAREYMAAGKHIRAAKLFKDEGLYDEAASAYYASLGNAELDEMSLDKYYAYAALLVLAGDRDKAADIYTGIISVNPNFRDVKGRLMAIGMQGDMKPGAAPAAAGPVEERAEPTILESSEKNKMQNEIDDLFAQISKDAKEPVKPEKPEEFIKRESSLRSLLSSGRMEPRYSMRLWMQAVKKLIEKHKEGVYYGCISPDHIFVDMQNNMRLDPPGSGEIEYTAPELLQGMSPDVQTDVYAMGVVLYDMVVGSLVHLHDKSPSEQMPDVPDWLNDLIMKCMAKDRSERYKGFGEVTKALAQLKAKEEQG